MRSQSPSFLGVPGFDSRIGQRDRSGSPPTVPSLGQGKPNASDNIASTDYIDNGIAEIEAFLAEKSLATV